MLVLKVWQAVFPYLINEDLKWKLTELLAEQGQKKTSLMFWWLWADNYLLALGRRTTGYLLLALLQSHFSKILLSVLTPLLHYRMKEKLNLIHKSLNLILAFFVGFFFSFGTRYWQCVRTSYQLLELIFPLSNNFSWNPKEHVTVSSNIHHWRSL